MGRKPECSNNRRQKAVGILGEALCPAIAKTVTFAGPSSLQSLKASVQNPWQPAGRKPKPGCLPPEMREDEIPQTREHGRLAQDAAQDAGQDPSGERALHLVNLRLEL